MAKKNRTNNKKMKRSRAHDFKKPTKTVPQSTSLPIEQTFQLALHYFQKGKLLQAKKVCRQILSQDPDNADVNHLFGVIAAEQGGKNDVAIQFMRKAIKADPDNAEFHKNLGLIFKRKGRMEEAIDSFNKALAIKPDYAEAYNDLIHIYKSTDKVDEAIACYKKILSLKPDDAEAHNNLGLALKSAGKMAEAIASFQNALSVKPDSAEAYNNLGNAFQVSERIDEAITCFRKALSLKPDYAMAHYNLGVVFQKSGKMDEAIALFRKTVSIKPDYAAAHNNLGILFQKSGMTDEAVVSFRNALSIIPDYAEAHYNLGRVFHKSDMTNEAIDSYRKALSIKPDFVEALNSLGLVLKDIDKMEEAVDCFRQALTFNPELAEVHNNLGLALQDLNRIEEALVSFSNALNIDPDYAVARYNIGLICTELGRMDEAVASFRKALSIKPDYAEPYRGLSRIVKHAERDDVILAMEALYAKEDLADEDKIHLGFGLGKVFEDLKDYEKSFGYILEANRLKRESYKYSIHTDQNFFERIKQTFSSAFFSSLHGPGNPDATPLFILGMPRSGTTLVEQILSSHPLVYGAGELLVLDNLVNATCLRETEKRYPECIPGLKANMLKRIGSGYRDEIRKYSKDAEYIIDKMPHNFLFVGLIKAILPNVKVIHCMRQPMDNCFSIFKNDFSRKGSHRYAYNMTELGQYYNLYQDLMAHWEKVLPGFMYSLNYEEMVADQQNQTKRLLDFCGLPWDEACLAFHKTERRVKTASSVQVRQPMYKDSVELWKRYEVQLEPLRKEIQGK